MFHILEVARRDIEIEMYVISTEVKKDKSLEEILQNLSY